eukprot:3363211-Pleurochrysis_carterae.AAC.1
MRIRSVLLLQKVLGRISCRLDPVRGRLLDGRHGQQADNDLRIFRDRFKLTLQDKPKQFLGMNIEMRDDGGVKISAAAY